MLPCFTGSLITRTTQRAGLMAIAVSASSGILGWALIGVGFLAIVAAILLAAYTAAL
jgi:hypothetical protein